MDAKYIREMLGDFNNLFAIIGGFVTVVQFVSRILDQLTPYINFIVRCALFEIVLLEFYIFLWQDKIEYFRRTQHKSRYCLYVLYTLRPNKFGTRKLYGIKWLLFEVRFHNAPYVIQLFFLATWYVVIRIRQRYMLIRKRLMDLRASEYEKNIFPAI